MESRQYGLPSSSRQLVPPPREWNTVATHAWPAAARPLSDIRELTEPSLLEATARKPMVESHRRIGSNPQSAMKRETSIRRGASVRIVESTADSGYNCEADDSDNTGDSPASLRDTSSMYSIPLSSVPLRSSSQTKEHTRTARRMFLNASPTPLQQPKEITIPSRGQSHSPVKQASVRLDAVSSQTSRPAPPRTFIRTPYPKDILEYPSHRHPRIGLDLQVVAPLFVGGGSIEGCVRIVVDDADRIRVKKNLTIGRLAVDLVGVEETSGNRKSIFLSLGTELLDPDHPPPRNMIDPDDRHQGLDSFWTLTPSFSSLAFIISLPLDTGPPPFHSKHARVRFILCATLLIKDSGRQYLVRCSQDIAVVSTYDPEKALRSLPSPLNACDELTFSKSGVVESTKVTAGLHRQVWVSGSTIFVDVHVSNNSRKAIKKLELSLERDILCYRHAAAATLEQSASQARIFESNDRSILSKSCLKQGMQGWAGVEAYGSVTRTCDLDIPRGHATVKCGKYFEVRYFLNLCVSTSHTKLISVQLPIILIHMNSLDVVPNSVAQVAAAIEEKRSHHHRGRSRGAADPLKRQPSSRRPQFQATPSPVKQNSNLNRRPSKIQGRAFAAPRQQSLERSRAEAADLQQLGTAIASSPRKFMPTGTDAQRRGKRINPEQSRLRAANQTINTTIISRPAREIHKQPSNLSLGGISVGSYTIYNDSSNSGIGMDYATPPSKRKGRIFDLSVPTRSPDEDASPPAPGMKGSKTRMRSTRSADSALSRKSNATGRSRWRDHFAPSKKENSFGSRLLNSSLSNHRQQTTQDSDSGGGGGGDSVGAYSLGLTTHTRRRPVQMRPSRQGVVGVARALSWRSRDEREGQHQLQQLVDPSRFEFEAVKRKPSAGGGFKEWFGGLRAGAGAGGKHDTGRSASATRRGNWI